ncbi:hypothetical protein [Ornithinimicrobium kibberense]|uniref:hypothetical protein n=1 Tax=Ornithinimicrobium kibberense TaxID=282060 RepID=UPI003616DBED
MAIHSPEVPAGGGGPPSSSSPWSSPCSSRSRTHSAPASSGVSRPSSEGSRAPARRVASTL